MPKKAVDLELDGCGARGLPTDDGDGCAGVETQYCRGAVHFSIEQDHSVDAMKGKARDAGLLLRYGVAGEWARLRRGVYLKCTL